MTDLFAHRPGWFLVGPAIGLVLVGLFALVGVRMGVVGGVSDLVQRARGRADHVAWKGWFVLGIVLGALAFRLLGGPAAAGDGYGWLSRELSSDALVVAVLLVAGGL